MGCYDFMTSFRPELLLTECTGTQKNRVKDKGKNIEMNAETLKTRRETGETRRFIALVWAKHIWVKGQT